MAALGSRVSSAPAWLLGLVPLALIVAAVGVFAALGAPGLGDRRGPPVEELAVERTVLEFATMVNKLTGGRSGIKHLPGRPDDPRRRCPDITRARQLLGWEPEIPLEEGLRRLRASLSAEPIVV